MPVPAGLAVAPCGARGRGDVMSAPHGRVKGALRLLACGQFDPAYLAKDEGAAGRAASGAAAPAGGVQ